MSESVPGPFIDMAWTSVGYGLDIEGGGDSLLGTQGLVRYPFVLISLLRFCGHFAFSWVILGKCLKTYLYNLVF